VVVRKLAARAGVEFACDTDGNKDSHDCKLDAKRIAKFHYFRP